MSVPSTGANDDADLPLYGSKQYWEERYSRNFTNEDFPAIGPSPFHSWYFSYEDLRPIILALIAGGRDEAQKTFQVLDDSSRVKDPESESEIMEKHSIGRTSKELENTQKSASITPTEKESSGINVDVSDENQGNDNDSDEWEETEGHDSSSCDDAAIEEEDISKMECEGIVAKGKLSVLEIGCGDCPLGTGLAHDLDTVATESTGFQLVDRIVCTDYSSAVIEIMQRTHGKKRKSANEDSSKQGDDVDKASSKKFPVQFLEADARKLQFCDGSFHLILEKGTMDAMISDVNEGKSNCHKIVAECARVLSTGGCFFLVSHINAQTFNGENWLNEVVVPGLREGGANSSWTIEVHGSQEFGLDDDAEVRVAGDSHRAQESYGPVVYLMFKDSAKPTSEEGSDPPTIPLKFFTY